MTEWLGNARFKTQRLSCHDPLPAHASLAAVAFLSRSIVRVPSLLERSYCRLLNCTQKLLKREEREASAVLDAEHVGFETKLKSRQAISNTSINRDGWSRSLALIFSVMALADFCTLI